MDSLDSNAQSQDKPDIDPDVGLIPGPPDESSSELGVNELGAGEFVIGEAYRTDTLADSVLILLLLTGVQRLVGFARAVLFCRWLSPEQLGLWDMSFGFLMLAAPLSVLSIPAVYGRYIEYYRQRGLMRTLVRRTVIVSSVTAIFACIAIYIYSPWFSQLIFGSPDQSYLVELLAGTLIVVVTAHFFITLLTAMRNVRQLALIQFGNSALFAVFGAVLILSWSNTAHSIVVAYALACCITSFWALWYVRRAWRGLPKVERPLGHRMLWSKLVPFFVWVTITDLLANLFAIVDRYMIVHYSTGDGLAEVGQYHSSRIIPLLMISIALLLGGIITPHLSRDWEAGKQRWAKQRLMLFLKLLGLALFAGSVLMLIAAPLLFSIAFKGKFDAGRAVFPLTLTYCIWFGMALIAQNYQFLLEKARLGSLALLVGLVVNVVLNLILLPRYGLMGAVVATTVANFLALVVMCLLNWMMGFKLDLGAGVVLAVPILLIFGPWVSLGALALIVLASVFSNWVFSQEEREVLIETAWRYENQIRGFVGKKR